VTPDASQAPVQVGEVVAGKYRIERQLGSGGMGVVMAARHLALDEPVALKFVLGHRAGEREAIERMLREARATFRLRSKHAVRVHDVGELPSGTIYIVMELLEGRDLRAELTARGPLPEKEVVAHVLDTCDALEEAHALGIVHRDLKPHNLFLARSLQGGRIVKVLDFGMSKVDPELFEAGPLTRPETALGTPRYMAPEQWKSAAGVDARADIWALGVVMFELLTGKAPLAGLRPQDRIARMLGGGIPSPRELRPELSEAITRVVMRCLRGNPAERWPSVTHLATALRDAHPDVGLHAKRAEVTATGVTVAVPAEKLAARVASAFDAPTEAARATPPAPPTRRETPLARGRAPASDEASDDSVDLDAATEVRARAFTPAEVAAARGPVDRRQVDRRKMEATLRSAAPTEKTLPMSALPAGPARAAPGSHPPALLPSPSPAVGPAPLPAPALVPAPAHHLPPAALAHAPLPPPSQAAAMSPRTFGLVALGAGLSLVVAAAVVWAVARALSP
jgi:hypothetical protein